MIDDVCKHEYRYIRETLRYIKVDGVKSGNAPMISVPAKLYYCIFCLKEVVN